MFLFIRIYLAVKKIATPHCVVFETLACWADECEVRVRGVTVGLLNVAHRSSVVAVV